MSFKVQLRFLMFFCLFWPIQLQSGPLRFSENDLHVPIDGTCMQLQKGWECRLKDGKWAKFSIPGSLHRTGRFELRSYFSADSSAGADLYKLSFHGIYGRCTVFLNKKIIGAHKGGGFPFVFDVPKEMIDFHESNELYIEIDSRLTFYDTLPIKSQSQGLPIVRNSFIGAIELLPIKKPCATGLIIDRVNGSKDVQCKLALQMPAPSAMSVFGGKPSVAAELIPLNETRAVWHDILVVQPSQTQDCTIDFTIPGTAVENWDPHFPRLYQLKFDLKGPGLSVPVAAVTLGMRTIDFNDFFYINGRRMSLKIIEWVNDREFLSLPVDSTSRRIHEELVSIKEAGSNAVRVYPNPPPSIFLDECDRLGLLVLLDTPVINIPSRLLTDDLLNSAAARLSAVIQYYGNHPCVVAWGAGSGYDAGSAQAMNFLKQMRTVAAELDSRPVYAGRRSGTDVKARLPVDIEIIELSPDETKRMGEDSVASFPATRAILRLVVPLNWTGRTVESAERDQAFLLSMALKKIVFGKNIGILVSPYRDWRGDIPFILWGPKPGADLFVAGLVDTVGRKRVAYDVVQARFNNTEVPVVMPTEYVKDERPLFQVLGSVVLILFLILYRSNRQLRNYLRRIFLFPHGFYVELTENRHVNMPLTLLVALTAFSSIAVITSSFLYFMRTRLDFDEILSWLFFSPTVKSGVIWLIWNPLVLIVILTVSLVLLVLAQSIFFRIFILFQRRYVKPMNLFAFVLWIPANLLFTLPVAVIFYRMLSKPDLVMIGLLILGVLLFWLCVRIVRATVIVLQLSRFRSLVIYGLLFVLSCCFLFYYFEHTHSVTAFLPYWWSLWY